MYIAAAGWPLAVVGMNRISPGVFGRTLVLREHADGLRAAIPGVERRHLPDGLLGEQRHQFVDVVGLERRDVAAQLLLGLGGSPVPTVCCPRWGPTSSSWARAAVAGCSPRQSRSRWHRRLRLRATAIHRATRAPPAAAGERCCSAATNANRTDSLDSTTSAVSGSGSSQGTSWCSRISVVGSELSVPPSPDAADGAACSRWPSGRCWWRCGRATYAPRTCPRNRRRTSTPAGTSPAPGPRRRAPSPSCGSSAPAARVGTVARPPGTRHWSRTSSESL